MPIKPRGTVVRTPPDWFATLQLGGVAINGPCAGNLAGVGLFNNANDGSVIRVYGLNYFTTANQVLYFKSTQGSSGTPFTGKGSPASIDPRVAAGWGLIFTQATAGGVGSAIGGVTAVATTAYDLAPGHPIAIIPAGYMWSVECSAVNTQIIIGFRWLSAYN